MGCGVWTITRTWTLTPDPGTCVGTTPAVVTHAQVLTIWDEQPPFFTNIPRDANGNALPGRVEVPFFESWTTANTMPLTMEVHPPPPPPAAKFGRHH